MPSRLVMFFICVNLTEPCAGEDNKEWGFLQAAYMNIILLNPFGKHFHVI